MVHSVFQLLRSWRGNSDPLLEFKDFFLASLHCSLTKTGFGCNLAMKVDGAWITACCHQSMGPILGSHVSFLWRGVANLMCSWKYKSGVTSYPGLVNLTAK